MLTRVQYRIYYVRRLTLSLPSPLPLANKKMKIIAAKLHNVAAHSLARTDSSGSRTDRDWRRSNSGTGSKRQVPFVDTILLITDKKARIQIQGDDDQANRV